MNGLPRPERIWELIGDLPEEDTPVLNLDGPPLTDFGEILEAS